MVASHVNRTAQSLVVHLYSDRAPLDAASSRTASLSRPLSAPADAPWLLEMRDGPPLKQRAAWLMSFDGHRFTAAVSVAHLWIRTGEAPAEADRVEDAADHATA